MAVFRHARKPAQISRHTHTEEHKLLAMAGLAGPSACPRLHDIVVVGPNCAANVNLKHR